MATEITIRVRVDESGDVDDSALEYDIQDLFQDVYGVDLVTVEVLEVEEV